MCFVCDLVGIRTPNLLIRSEMLYPIELRNQFPYLGVQNYGFFLKRKIVGRFFYDFFCSSIIYTLVIVPRDTVRVDFFMNWFLWQPYDEFLYMNLFLISFPENSNSRKMQFNVTSIMILYFKKK